MGCGLCNIKKTTRWHRDTAHYAVLDCPRCGDKLVIIKDHKADKREAKTFAKSVITSTLYGNYKEVKRDCYEKSGHPHFHYVISGKLREEPVIDEVEGEEPKPPVRSYTMDDFDDTEPEN
jgi:hypothetical protein